jgi:hypothetical protein
MPRKQQTLAMAADSQSGYEQYRKPTLRDEFLKTMHAIMPWSALCAVVEPHYPTAGNGRPPIGLERMLRIHFFHVWTRRLSQVLFGDLKRSANMYTACLVGNVVICPQP